MPGVANGNGPSYISAHSADVILSDIRPVKLKPEALGAINVLLDEFLHIILTTSRSLSTEKLRSSLLTVLPTSLGKEALLEAEVELRAYWERTTSRTTLEDDSRTFHLQWSFELLRLKCSAYSTLNEDDEDPAAELRVNGIFSKAHSHPPQTTLLDPAALYLTAILESMCEHILSNVGRVAARDSSRTYATTNDLFVALCEDDSIYGFFRSMRVYQQIETMAEALTPKSRRSKSISRHDQSLSRTSSPHAEPSSTAPSSARSRPSFEGQPTNNQPSPIGWPRTSGEKLRRIDSGKAHKRSTSVKSDLFEESYGSTEDEAMQREFDDLMRSASTMKMSLTPDRLKTMEAFKQEKDQKGFARRPDAPFPLTSSGSPLLHRFSSGQGSQDTKNRSRQASASISTLQGIVPTRLRSLSTTTNPWGRLTRTNSVKTPSKPSLSSSLSPHPHPAADMLTASRIIVEKNGFPPRTRTKARTDSMDLFDILNRSNEDLSSIPSKSSPKPSSQNSRKVSQSTRDLIEFLAEGPPETPTLSRAARDLVDFLAEGPPDFASSTVSLDKSKGSSNRLQKMMSKLNLGNNEKAKGSSDVQRTPLHSRFEHGTLSSLANKPIPPRPPRAPNAPSAFPVCDVPDENQVISQNPIQPDPPLFQEKLKASPTPHPTSPSTLPQVTEKSSISIRPPPSAFVHSNGTVLHATSPPRSSSQHASRSPIKAAASPATVVKAAPTIAEPDIYDMHRLLVNATTADECRLIFGMFMARNGIPIGPSQEASSQAPDLGRTHTHTVSETFLESSLVELLLGTSTSFDLVAS